MISNLMLSGRRILVVEDEAMVAMMVEDMLIDEGCIVVEIAASLRTAIAAVEDENSRLDGAVLDVNLGGDKVFPVAEILSTRGIPFIFATGYGSAGIDAQFSGVPVLAKPYRSSDLKEALCAALNC